MGSSYISVDMTEDMAMDQGKVIELSCPQHARNICRWTSSFKQLG